MEILSQIKISLAGRAAEEIIFGEDNVTTGASNDIEKASRYIRDYIVKYGMDEEIGLIHMDSILGEDKIGSQMLLGKASEKMKGLYQETKQLIAQNKDILEHLASALLEKETLEEQEIASFFP